MEAILKFCQLEFHHLVFSHLSFSSQTHSHCQYWFPPFAQINFTHSFWLNLMMAAILNSDMLNSATAILDSNTLLSSLRFTQKHSHPALTLNQSNSIWLKIIPSHLTWLRQPSWILQSWVQPFYTKQLHSFILTQLDDDSHLQFGQLGFSHLSFSSQTHSHLPRLVPTICKNKTSLTLPSSPFAQNTSLIQSD